MENDHSYTTTDDGVTIEIDEDVDQEIGAKELKTRKVGPWIRPPLRFEDVRLSSVDKLRIGNLSNEAYAVLCSHLNMPSYGSLKNWDSIAVHLEIPDHEIMSLRNDSRPMEAVLNKYRDVPLKDLIRALQTCRRIDMLYSLKNLEQKGRLTRPMEQHVGINSVSTSLMSTSVIYDDFNTDSVRSIFLVHYEEGAQEIRDFKWFRKNLMKHANERGFRIVDISTLDIDANITSSVEEAFAKAYQIVVTFTPSHIEAVKCRSTACRSVVYAHDLMNQEFFTLNSINKRFRAVTFNDTQQSSLPLGWPRSTLVYQFPLHMGALCAKIFNN
ncbi:hypothetical protein KIN20_024565 [Parelaphostrongylus tenuis]|uniref:Death domain-containing protein n=1 Tax=Parelaphostrongylus tenuis TaxID=148309 RepID=A0AAD5QW22_PARTN|nr:hypothetical protein KIN20_024565 [Parelaphostrongylus tenuis]